MLKRYGFLDAILGILETCEYLTPSIDKPSLSSTTVSFISGVDDFDVSCLK
jgi:hypothetical protein